MAGKINVVFEDGTLHFLKVTESLGYNHDAGAYCKIVEYQGKEILAQYYTLRTHHIGWYDRGRG